MEAAIYGCMKNKIDPVIVDFGMGNLWSVYSALRYLGTDPIISSDPSVVKNADVLLLPGVGSFYKAISELNSRGLSDAIREAVLSKRRKILGICLGMQLLAEKGREDGNSEGLGIIPGVVDRFLANDLIELKLPHIGFNEVNAHSESVLFNGIVPPADFYFVHSYRLLPEGIPGILSTCKYGKDFLAAIELENIFATQFHPEKSQTNGLKLLKNFLEV